MARRIAEYKQVGTHKEKRIIHHEAEIDPITGEIIKPAWDEEIEIDVPDYDTVYRDMTPEEEEEADRREAEEEARRRQEPPTEMEILEAQVTYTALCTDTLLEEE